MLLHPLNLNIFHLRHEFFCCHPPNPTGLIPGEIWGQQKPSRRALSSHTWRPWLRWGDAAGSWEPARGHTAGKGGLLPSTHHQFQIRATVPWAARLGAASPTSCCLQRSFWQSQPLSVFPHSETRQNPPRGWRLGYFNGFTFAEERSLLLLGPHGEDSQNAAAMPQTRDCLLPIALVQLVLLPAPSQPCLLSLGAWTEDSPL